MDTIIKNLATSNSENFATAIAYDLIKQAQAGKKIKFVDKAMLPLSDNVIYSKIFSIINTYLTNSGIKQSIPGILSVLTPSYDLFKIYIDKNGNSVKYESFSDPDTELIESQM